MIKSIGRNVLLVVALGVGVTVSGLASHFMISPRGVFGPTLLSAVSVPTALLGVLIALAVATGLGIVVARTSNTAVGMFAFGGGLFGLSWRMAAAAEIAHGNRGGTLSSVSAQLALESVLWSLLIVAGTWLVFRLGGPMRDVEPTEDGETPNPLWSFAALKMVLAGVLVLPVVWFIAQAPSKGQAIGAAFCGGMAVGLAGRLISPHVQPILLFGAPLLFGAVGHVAAGIMAGATPLETLFVQDGMPALAATLPVDYATGAVMGVAVGLGWAKSFLHHEDAETAPDSVTA